MARATNDDWNRYYEGARHRRRVSGGDPIERYLERKETREKQLFIGSGVLLLALLVAYCSALVR